MISPPFQVTAQDRVALHPPISGLASFTTAIQTRARVPSVTTTDKTTDKLSTLI